VVAGDASFAPTRGRPRQQGLGARIRSAAGAELLDGGVAAFSIRRVARRAGVAAGTVSLRYPDPLDLIVDAMAELFAWEPVPPLGDLPSELRILADRLVSAAFEAPMFALSQSLLAMAAQRPEVWTRYVDRVTGAGLRLSRVVFDQAVDRGEIDPAINLDAIVTAFVGGLQMATLAHPQMNPPSAEERADLVAVALAACRYSNDATSLGHVAPGRSRATTRRR
jgi:AcrR family transcriptional regulator